MVLDFDETFKTLMCTHKLIGTHPHTRKGIIWHLRSFLMQAFLALVFCLLIYNILYHNLRVNDHIQMIKNGAIALIYIVITFQYFVLLYYKESFQKMIKDMKLDYRLSKELSIIEKNILEKYAKQGIYVCRQWLLIGITCPSSFLLKSLFLMVYYYFKYDFRLINYYELVYPSMIEDHKDNFYVFLFKYAVIATYGFYAGIVYVAYVPLGPMMMLHACGQLELVKNRIDDLFMEGDKEVINRNLKGIIRHLQYIYGFVNKIQRMFMVAYEINLKGSTLLLPFAFYEVIQAKNRGEVSMEYISLIAGGILISSAPCYYSELLMEKGEDVRISLYSCGWEQNYDKRVRNTLHIMLTHALRPIAIRSLFRTMCLDALTDLFQQCYAIFNLLNAVWG